MKHLELPIPGQCESHDDCNVCIRDRLRDMPGVESVRVQAHTLVIDYDQARFDPAMLQSLEGWGACRIAESFFRAAGGDASAPAWRRTCSWVARNNELILIAISGITLLAGWITFLLAGPEWLRLSLIAVSAVSSSTRTFPEALHILRRFRLDVDVLMFAAAIGAASLGHYEEGAFLLFLFGLGSAGEHLALGRARKAIESLTQLAPDTAIRIDNGVETTVKADRLEPDDRILIRPFDRVAVDAQIVEGTSELDQSSITGESVPVARQTGDEIFSGTLNGEGRLVARVLRPVNESTLARIVKMVEEAQEQKSTTQRFTDRIEVYYVPIVFVVTLLLIVLVPWLTDLTWGRSFYNAMAFLTAASPCALAIGTPAAVLCGVAKAARIGVLIKGGAHLEALARVKAIAMDKTGTLTAGRPAVSSIVTVEGLDVDRALAVAAAIETHANHPLGAAIVEAAKKKSLALPDASDVSQRAGVGMIGTVDGRVYQVGKADSVENLPSSMRAQRDRLAAEGCTIVAMTENGRGVAILGLLDQPRESAKDAVDRVRAEGITEIAMLTGDHPAAAQSVAKTVGIDSVHADLLPEQKLALIDELTKRNGPVAMIGDGVNDAPALARAEVGIAIGAAGTQVAMETADVVLMGHDLTRLADALRLSHRARRIVIQNLVIALGVICIVAPLSALGFTSLGIAVLLHEGSTVVVVLNALRLLR